MELNELRIYTKVIQTGSFTKAAEALNSHKAVLSRSLSQLEAKLGVRLLERSTRSLRPTEIGQTIYFALKEAALQHLGIVRLPYLLAQPLLDTHALQVILPEWQIPSTPVHAILPSNRWLTPKVKSFLACSPLH